MDQMELFNRILASLHEAALDDAHWPQASRLIDEACGSKGNILMLGDVKSNEDARLSFARICYRGQRRADRERSYVEDFFPVDESVPRFLALTPGYLTHLPTLYTKEELQTSRVYREAHPVFQTDNSVLALLHGPGGSNILWANANPVDSHGWQASRTAMIGHLLPHVRQYVHVRQALVDAQALSSSLGALLDNSSLGIVQLDLRGRIVEANDVALGLLRDASALFDEGGFLRAVSPAEDVDLQELLARALPSLDHSGAGSSMAIGRAAPSRRLILHVLPIRHRSTDFRTRRAAMLVVLAEPGRRPAVDARLVGAVFGLTPMQSQVAVSLGMGSTPVEIAAATGRKLATVRWHIRRVFAKTGVSRQAELMNLVLNLKDLPGERQ